MWLLPTRQQRRQGRITVRKRQHKIITRLFATATSIAEAAHEASFDGQAHDASMSQYQLAARRILSATHDLEVLAEVIGELVDHADDPCTKRP